MGILLVPFGRSYRYHMLSIILSTLPTTTAVPTRRSGASSSGGTGSGGGSGSSTKPAPDFTPNYGHGMDYLPNVKRWDGVPFVGFRKTWYEVAKAALGSIVQEGATLLECALRTDPGRDPNDDADDVRHHLTRSLRLYNSLLNYISPQSYLYKTILRNIAGTNDPGPALFEFLYHYGHQPLDEETKQKYLDIWEHATLDNQRIPIDRDSLWAWWEWIEDMAAEDKADKTPNQIRDKFFKGLPRAFDPIVAQERMNPTPGSYVFGNGNYPNHHPLRGTAVAASDRTKPDMVRILQIYTPEWIRMLPHIKPVPRGSVRQTIDDYDNQCQSADDDAHDDDDGEHIVNQTYDSQDSSHEQAMAYLHLARGMLKNSITWQTICLVCGGLGHASMVDGKSCLTKDLGTEVRKSTLIKIRYPNGLRRPTFGKSTGERSKRDKSKHSSKYSKRTEGSPSTSSADRAEGSTPRPHKNRRSPKYGKKKVKVLESEPESAVESDSSNTSDQSDNRTNQLAMAYQNIDIRDEPYKSYSSDSDSSTDSKPTKIKAKRSPTTKAKKA